MYTGVSQNHCGKTSISLYHGFTPFKGKYSAMASGKFVEKQLLINQIEQIAAKQESAFFSILTDMKRSVLLRFSAGKLIHIHCRRSDAGQTTDAVNAANAINECGQLKFVRTNNEQPKDKPEVMPVDVFLKSIGVNSAVPSLAESVTGFDTPLTSAEPVGVAMTPDLQDKFAEIARDYIGLVADMLVPDICGKEQSLEATIEQIAEAMPVQSQSTAFRERALTAAGVNAS